VLDKQNLVAIRDFMPEEDRNFILASWLKGLYYGDSWFHEIPKHIFMQNYHALLERVLSPGVASVKVACLKDDPDVILGYAVLNPAGTALHWVFVKNRWRGIGIAKSLIPPSVSVVTHLTKVGLSILKKHPGVHFNPFVI
jgi:hypothetical protein